MADMKTEEESSFKPAEGMSPINDQPNLENIDSTHSALQMKVKQCTKYSCRVCDFGTKKQRKYVDHIGLHQKEGHLFCSLCDFVSLNAKLFKKHFRTHKNDLRETNNSILNKGSISKIQLAHEDTPLGLDLPSLSSNSTFLPRGDSDEKAVEKSSVEQLSEEDGKLPKRKENENLDEKKSFSCAVCEFKTQYKHSLTRHVKIHTGDKPFSCTFSGCNYSSRQKRGLVSHFLSGHSKEKPYLCKLCGEAFKGKHSLNSHVLNHRGRRSYSCLYKGCEYSSNRASNLKEHIRTHTKEKPYYCYFEGCGYSCTTISSLNVHVRTHTGERPYPCHFKCCNYSASNKRNLENHILTHTGAKPFRCDFNDCKFSCSQSGHLKEHVLLHLSKNPYTCPECKFRSRRPLEIEQHLETHHELQNTSRSSDRFQPNAPIRESPTESVTNIFSTQAQPSLSSQNNNDRNSKTQDAATPSKKYLCTICDFESKSKKKYNAHLDSHRPKRKNVTPEVSFTSHLSVPSALSNENSLQTQNTSEVVKKSAKVTESPDNANEMALRKHKRIRTEHNFKKVSELCQVSSSSTHIHSSLQLKPPASKCNLYSSRRRKTSLAKPGTQKEEGSSAGVDVIEAISPTKDQLCVVTNDLPQSASQVIANPWRKYCCPNCESGTNKKRKYKDHVELHQEEGYLFCSLCDFSVLNSKRFKKHLRTHENGPCNDDNSEIQSSGFSQVPLVRQETSLDALSSFSFLNSQPLQLGDEADEAADESVAAIQPPENCTKLLKMKYKGTSDESKIYYCSICEYKTNKASNLTRHDQVHTGKRTFSCTYSGCNYSFAIKYNLTTHLLVMHSDEKLYSCQLCDEAFKSKHLLDSHVINHTGRRPHQCLYKNCEYSCTSSRNLKTHIRTHTKEKPHRCNFDGCDFSCSGQFNLKLHFRTHTGDRPYHCTFKNCNFSAAHSSNLKTHSFIHTKVKPFHCDFSDCKFSCAQSSYLKLHIMQHLTQNHHACPKCKFRSCTSLEIEQHLETHHKLQNASNTRHLQPNAPTTESATDSVTNILRVRGGRGQSSYSSQNNNKSFSETLDEVRPSKKYICAACGFESKSKKKHKTHLESHVEKRQLSETRDTKLTNHKNNSKEESYISSNRSQKKENSTALFVESKKSLAPFSCNFCKKSFAKEMKLFNHLRYHTGQKMPRL